MKKTYLLFLASLALSSAAFGKTVDISSFEELLPYSEQPEDGTVLRVVSDFTVEEYLPFLLADAITFDLNGHTVYFEGNLGITGIGVFNIVDSDPEGKGSAIALNKGMFTVGGTATLSISGGNFSSDSSYPYPLVNNLAYSYIDISGGRFYCPTHASVIENTGTLQITGGTFSAGVRNSSPLITSVGEAVTTISGGAFYAGNNTAARCFYTLPYVTDEYEEIPILNLPEGVIDGGAVVLDERWAIPGTFFINYATGDDVQMQPGMHYYTPGEAFQLPECDRRYGMPFAGWTEEEEDASSLLTAVTAETNRNLQLYPVWKYVDLADGVNPDLRPVSINPEAGSMLESLSSIVLYFSESDEMDLYVNPTLAEKACVQKMNWGTPEFYCNVTLDTSWDGSLTVSFDKPLEERGDYRVFIPAGAVGNDDYEYGDYQEGRCNPDLFLEYTIDNNQVSGKGMTTEPENGATIASLKEIRFIFEDDTVMYDYDKEAFLSDADGNILMTLTALECNYDDEAIVMVLPEEISTPGVYTLSIPAGFFGYDWGSDPIAASVFTWIVDPTTVGVTGISSGEVRTTEYFDLSGHSLSAPIKGLMIIKQTKTDGSVEIKKSMK